MLRLTWVQPEDLLGHELRQAAQDGRDASGVERRWREAGGLPPPSARERHRHPRTRGYEHWPTRSWTNWPQHRAP